MGLWLGRVVCFLAAFAVAGGLTAEPKGAPIAVSPGGPESFLVAGSTCPTFSWAVADAGTAHELVVQEVPDADALEMADRPALQATLPAGASSWTPPLDGCLAPDRAYAWVVRAARNQPVEALALDPLHGEEVDPAVLFHRVDGDDGRMVQGRDRFGLVE